MTLKKKMIAVAAAGALSAAAAVPALAFENEFHGMFQVQGITSNLLTGTTGQVEPTTANLHPNKTYVDQRARIQYIAKASDDLKLVTHFELDGRWGDNSYGGAGDAKRNNGYALGGDTISLETKNVYLDFNTPGVPVNVKVGLQGWGDAYKGVFFNNDAAGVVATTKQGNGKYSAGWFRFDDARAAGQTLGKPTRDFLLLDGVYNLSKDTRVGGSYYYYNDDYSITNGGVVKTAGGINAAIHMLGVNGSTVVGPVTLDGFVLYQNGTAGTGGPKTHLSAFAANVGAKAKVGVGTVKASFLYASGSKSGQQGNSFVSLQNETSAAYMESGIFADANTVLMFRGNSYRTSNTDQSVIADANNNGAGVAALFLGYNGEMGKTFFNVNAAAVAAAKKQDNVTAAAYDDKAVYAGTELNAEVGYKIYDNLKASVQYAYAFLGPRYTKPAKTDEANNPYLARVVLGYTF